MYRQLLDDLIYHHSTSELKNNVDNLIYSHQNALDILVIGNDHKVFRISQSSTIVDIGKYQTDLVKIKKKAKQTSNKFVFMKISSTCRFCGDTIDRSIKDSYICWNCFTHCEFNQVKSTYSLLSNYITKFGLVPSKHICYFFNNMTLLLSYNNITLQFQFLEKTVKYPLQFIPNNIQLFSTGKQVSCLCHGKGVYCPYILKYRFTKIYAIFFLLIGSFNIIDPDIILLIKWTMKELLLQ